MSDPRHRGPVWEAICELRRLSKLFDGLGDAPVNEPREANAYWHASAECMRAAEDMKNKYYASFGEWRE